MPTRLILVATVFAAYCSTTAAQSLVSCEGGTASNFPCANIDLASNLTPNQLGGNSGKDIWGWEDPQDGTEYVIITLDNGTAFVEISDPTNPVILGHLPTNTISSTWRDVKVYNDHAFIVADGADNHGMQVFDLTRLRSVPSPPETFTPDNTYGGIGSAHNIVINEDTGFAYAVGVNNECSGGFVMINIQDPDNPTGAGCADQGYTHDAQCVIYDGPDKDYTGSEICIGANGRFDSSDFVTIIDVTDKDNPVLIANVTHPNPGYSHQGWFTEDMRFWVMNDELDETDIPLSNTRTVMFDLEDLDNPEFHAFYFSPLGSSDHNLYIRGDYAFLSNYSSGLRVLDVADIENGILSEVAVFDTYPDDNGPGTYGQWSNYPYFNSGYVALSDGVYGLFLVKTTFPINTASETSEIPANAGYSLSAAYPNPFSDASKVVLTVEHSQHVVAELFDVTGRRVASLFTGDVAAGTPIDIEIAQQQLPAGLYLIHVQGESFAETQRISFIR